MDMEPLPELTENEEDGPIEEAEEIAPEQDSDSSFHSVHQLGRCIPSRDHSLWKIGRGGVSEQDVQEGASGFCHVRREGVECHS